MVLVQASLAGAVELVGTVGVAHANLRFEVPVLGEQPLVAVGDTATDIPAFVVTAVLALLGKRLKGQVHIPYIILSAEGVDTEEGTAKGAAGPVAVFGHDIPEAHALTVVEGPGVHRAKDLHGVARPRGPFGTGIEGCRGPPEDVRLQGEVLGVGWLYMTAAEEEYSYTQQLSGKGSFIGYHKVQKHL